MAIIKKINQNHELVSLITKQIEPDNIDYVPVEEFKVEVVTFHDEEKTKPKAVKLSEDSKSWCPFTVLRTDRFSNLYMDRKFFEEKFGQ